jgi:hypothetical protein
MTSLIDWALLCSALLSRLAPSSIYLGFASGGSWLLNLLNPPSLFFLYVVVFYFCCSPVISLRVLKAY